MTPLSRVVNPLLQRPLEMWKALRRTPKPQRLADIISPLLTQLALSTWQPDFEGHAIASFEVSDRGADGGDDACGFMAESERFLDNDVAVAVVIEVVKVGTAETCGLD